MIQTQATLDATHEILSDASSGQGRDPDNHDETQALHGVVDKRDKECGSERTNWGQIRVSVWWDRGREETSARGPISARLEQSPALTSSYVETPKPTSQPHPANRTHMRRRPLNTNCNRIRTGVVFLVSGSECGCS